jgi:hypothetical protein
MERRLLVESNRQLAIAVRLAGVEQVVAGAVHGFERHFLALGAVHLEHVLAIVRPVAGRLPQRLVVDDRRLDFDVAVRQQHLAHVIRERVVERRPFVLPEGRARRPRVKREQPEIFAQLAVVALLGFFDLREIRLQLLVGEERGPVDALHRLIARVALPVGVRRAEQLERFQFPVDGTCGPTQKSMKVSLSLIV